MTYTVKKIGVLKDDMHSRGWYNFEDIPQGYIRICNLACGTDRKAINLAKRICTDREAAIVLA